MSIKSHFEAETLENAQVVLTDEEEAELLVFIDELITASGLSENSNTKIESIRNIAGLSFMAGRSFQKDQDQELFALLEQAGEAGEQYARDMQSQQDDGMVHLALTPEAVSRLLNFVLGGD